MTLSLLLLNCQRTDLNCWFYFQRKRDTRTEKEERFADGGKFGGKRRFQS